MGGRASALTVGLAAPADLPAQWALDLARGIAEECALVGACVVGGDVTAADQVMLAVTALGSVAGEPVRRSGARPGDVVALAGRQGWAAAGLAVLARGFRSPRALVEAYQRPEPPYAAGPAAAPAGATAMIDVSDGLLADVGHIAGDPAASPSTSAPTPSRSPSRCTRSALRWALTRCSSSWRRGRPRARRDVSPGRAPPRRGWASGRSAEAGESRSTVSAYDGPRELRRPGRAHPLLRPDAEEPPRRTALGWLTRRARPGLSGRPCPPSGIRCRR